jgi:hypothetical protein
MGPWIAIVIVLFAGLNLADWLLHHPLTQLMSGAASLALVVVSNRGKQLGLPGLSPTVARARPTANPAQPDPGPN